MGGVGGGSGVVGFGWARARRGGQRPGGNLAALGPSVGGQRVLSPRGSAAGAAAAAAAAAPAPGAGRLLATRFLLLALLLGSPHSAAHYICPALQLPPLPVICASEQGAHGSMLEPSITAEGCAEGCAEGLRLRPPPRPTHHPPVKLLSLLQVSPPLPAPPARGPSPTHTFAILFSHPPAVSPQCSRRAHRQPSVGRAAGARAARLTHVGAGRVYVGY